MRTPLVTLALLCLFVRAAYGEGTSDAAAIEQWVRITRIAIADVRTKLRPMLSDEEQKVLSQIEFRVDPTIAFAGNARKRGDRRTIVISAGVAFLMNVLGQSMAVGERGNVPCMQTHLLRSIKDALEGMGTTSSSERRRVWPMVAFAQIEPACRGADRLIAGDKEMERIIGATTKIGLSLVILHEIGHQLLDHVDDTLSDPPKAGELALSRINEDEADRWAIEKAVKIGEPFILAMPYLLIMSATTLNNITLEGERSSTHPSGARRALVLLTALEKELREAGMAQDMLESVTATRRQLERILPAPR